MIIKRRRMFATVRPTLLMARFRRFLILKTPLETPCDTNTAYILRLSSMTGLAATGLSYPPSELVSDAVLPFRRNLCFCRIVSAY